MLVFEMIQITTNIQLLLFTSAVFSFDQNDYNIILEHMENVGFNRNYLQEFNVVSFKYNRTNVAMNTTTWYKRAVGNMKVEIQAYKFASNEYRLFPLRFAFDFCDSIAKNDYGLREMYNCGNLSTCPLKKGNFHVCNWAPNARKFPPYIPEGKYKLDIKYFIGPVEIAFYRGFGTVKKIHEWDFY